MEVKSRYRTEHSYMSSTAYVLRNLNSMLAHITEQLSILLLYTHITYIYIHIVSIIII